MQLDFKSVLFLGIGGVSMHQLAIALKKMGKSVVGYDQSNNEYVIKCRDCGIDVSNKFDKNFLQVDLCVKTGAIKDCRYLTELKRLGIKIIDRAELLSFFTEKFKTVIAVAGTHGKSTTASLIYEILRVASKKVSCHIGADVFAPRFELGDDYLIVEACEYNKSFLFLNPTISVVTNVEADHLDSYGSLFNLKNAFSVFLKRGKSRFIYNEKSTEYLKQIKCVNIVDKTNLEIMPKIKGEHNLKNISLAVAVCKSLGVGEEIIIKAVNSFVGVPRRYQFIGFSKNTKVFIDYAHHPTEINSFVQTFNKEDENILYVFQPHTFSRTKFLLKDFIKVLSGIENLIIYKEYSAREKPWQGISAKQLFDILKEQNSSIKYCASERKIVKDLDKFKYVAFVGAGNIDQIAKKIVKSY